ncbi:MAG: hypothetical protein NXI22_02700 [bacterium]|nr:hypothetical protein [bacterium]
MSWEEEGQPGKMEYYLGGDAKRVLAIILPALSTQWEPTKQINKADADFKANGLGHCLTLQH